MVNFSSLSSYLHHPNWPQQQPAGDLGGGGDQERQMAPPPPRGGGGDGRMTKPDIAMKCPRCESTNTKFCYFNNYSLSQPRHFCKTCRRYWTRGGALRNVPMGGGCRRNKKTTKGSSRGCRSKSPGATTTSNILGHLPHTTRPPQFPILPPVNQYGGRDPSLTFEAGNGNNFINTGHASNKVFANFSFLEATDGGYGEQVEGMKMEENYHQQQHRGMNMSRNFSGNDQFLGTSNAAWGTTDLSGLTSSSTN